jgi:hypothetical protein
LFLGVPLGKAKSSYFQKKNGLKMELVLRIAELRMGRPWVDGIIEPLIVHIFYIV